MRTSSKPARASTSAKALMRGAAAVVALYFAGSVALPLLASQISHSTVAPSQFLPAFISSAQAASKKAASAADIASAVKLIGRGKIAKAETVLNRAISSGKLQTTDMAKALHYRGIALRKQGKPAQAIADFTNAIFLKNGLPPALRKDAEAQRAAAYTEASNADKLARPAARRKTANIKAPRRTAAAPLRPAGGSWQTRTSASGPIATARKTNAQPKPSSGTGIGSFFSNLFSGSKTTAKPANAPGTKATRKQRPLTQGKVTQVSSWNSQTSVLPVVAQRQKGTAAAHRHAATRRTAARRTAARSKPVLRPRVLPNTQRASVGARRIAPRRQPAAAKSYRLILSPVRSPEVAKTNANKLQTQFASLLAQRQPVIETTTFGGGTFYQVRIGPFADARAPQSICAKLKADGVDCILTRQ